MTFIQAAQELIAANEAFVAGSINPSQHRYAREDAMSKAMDALAGAHGVNLQKPLQLDSNGEMSLVAMPLDGSDPRYGTGQFGTLSAVLNQYQPRCGVAPGAVLPPQMGWCRMNHFQVEKMILDCFHEQEGGPCEVTREKSAG